MYSITICHFQWRWVTFKGFHSPAHHIESHDSRHTIICALCS